MKFLTLKINNFLTLGEGVAVALADRGLNIIQGVNEDDSSANSNGAGKSSIVDALCWCLFGITARDEKGDAIVNRTAKKNTVVEVTLLNGDTGYRITRHRKHATHKNQLHIEAFNPADTMLPGAAGVRMDKGTEAESQKELEKILGCSHEVFVAAVYAGQERMPDLPRMTDRELKRLIEEAAGMERIERAYQVSRDRMNAAKTELEKVQVRIGNAENSLVRWVSSRDLKQAEAKTWEEGRASSLAEHADRVSKAEGLLGMAKTAAEAALTRRDRIKSRLTELEASLTDHTAATARVAAARTALATAERGVDRSAVTLVSSRIKTIESKIAAAPAHMSEPCTECGKPHTPEELEGYLKVQQTQLDAAREEAKGVTARVKEQLAAVELAKKALADAEAAVPDVSATNTEIRTLRGQLDEIKTAEDALRLAHQNLTAAKERHELAKSSPNPYTEAVKAVQASIDDTEKSLVELRLQEAERRRDLEVLQDVVRMFGPAGVRAQILDTVTPYLNARTADYLSVLSDGHMTAIWSTLTKSAAGDLKEKFSIQVASETGGESFGLLSGGEKRKVRLACALALQDLVASRAVQPIELWLGDEIDDALDVAGLERLMTILERKARERGTVLVISHNELSDWCDNVTTVRKRDGRSVVEGALVE